MDALKSAGRAFIRSPGLAKRSWNSGRHTKLLENWTDTRETILEGMTFNLRHLGMTLVDQSKGEDLSATAVKRIMATAKASGKKPQKVTLKVSPQGILLCDSLTSKLIENVSIYRISYCTADKLHHKVFAYIAQNTLNGTLECHAYLCSKRKVAQAVTLTVAQAFRVAFELWQDANEEKEERMKSGSAGKVGDGPKSERSKSVSCLKGTDVVTDNLVDFEELHISVVLESNLKVESNGNVEESQVDNRRPTENNGNNNRPLWEVTDVLDEAFSRLAASRTNPQVLDIGVTSQEWLMEPNWDNANGNTPHRVSPTEDDFFGF